MKYTRRYSYTKFGTFFGGHPVYISHQTEEGVEVGERCGDGCTDVCTCTAGTYTRCTAASGPGSGTTTSSCSCSGECRSCSGSGQVVDVCVDRTVIVDEIKATNTSLPACQSSLDTHTPQHVIFCPTAIAYHRTDYKITCVCLSVCVSVCQSAVAPTAAIFIQFSLS